MHSMRTAPAQKVFEGAPFAAWLAAEALDQQAVLLVDKCRRPWAFGIRSRERQNRMIRMGPKVRARRMRRYEKSAALLAAIPEVTRAF